LVEAYLQLGIVGEARTAAAVLGHNYPGTEWYEDSYTLMAEYGKEPRGKPVMQAKVGEGSEVTPVAQPAPGAAATISAPLPAAAIAPPPAELRAPAPAQEPEAATTATDTTAPAPEAEKKDDEGGFFDWF
jgi:outer membrane protein assembly factor BamD